MKQPSSRGCCGDRRGRSADSGGLGLVPPPNAADRQPVMGVLPDTVRPGSFCLILSGNAVHPRPGRRRRAPRRHRAEVKVHCPPGPAAALTRWCAPAQARALTPSQGTLPPLTLAGGPLTLGWASCRNKPLGRLRVWGPGLASVLLGTASPTAQRAPLGSLCHHTQRARETECGHRPERRECGQPTPAAQPGALPTAKTSSLPPHLYQAGVPQEGKTEAAQTPNSHPRWEEDPRRAVPRNPAALPAPYSVGDWRALG